APSPQCLPPQPPHTVRWAVPTISPLHCCQPTPLRTSSSFRATQHGCPLPPSPPASTTSPADPCTRYKPAALPHPPTTRPAAHSPLPQPVHHTAQPRAALARSVASHSSHSPLTNVSRRATPFVHRIQIPLRLCVSFILFLLFPLNAANIYFPGTVPSVPT